MAQDIRLDLIVDDKGSAVIRNAALKSISAFDALQARSTNVSKIMRSNFKTVAGSLGSIVDKILNWKTALAGLVVGAGFGALAKSALTTASSFENMRLSLDTMTKGQGAATLRELNEWALKMPVNTEKAVKSFIMMKAMGLDPTISQMTTLVDTMSALGGNAEVLEGIARALGQISTKGKVSAEELMQLAERGVPVFDILREKFGEVDSSTISAGQAIEAIFAGLDERFGGMAKKQQSAWSGMVETIKSYYTEFQKMVMESGVFDYLKEKLSGMVDWLDQAKWSGQMEEFAQGISDWIVPKLKEVEEFVRGIKSSFGDWKPVLQDVKGVLDAIWAVIKLAASGINGLVKLANWYEGTTQAAADEARRLTANKYPLGQPPSIEGGGALSYEEGGQVVGGGSKAVTVVNNFNQNLSRSDINNIAQESQRQAYRDEGGWLNYNFR